MAYSSPPEEEHMLAFTPSQKSSTQGSQSQTQTVPSTAPPQHQPPIDNSLACTTERVLSYVRTTWTECRPWHDFYSTRYISIPPFAALSDRFATNLHLYRANYQVVTAFWLAFVLLRRIPHVLLGAALFLLLERWCARQASKNGNTLHHRHQVIAALAALTILWITGLGLFAFAALTFSAVTIGMHASLHEPNHVETEIATV